MGADKSALTHWNDIDVAAFYSNLKSVTDLNVGLLSSMSFSGFLPSPMVGGVDTHHYYTLERY